MQSIAYFTITGNDIIFAQYYQSKNSTPGRRYKIIYLDIEFLTVLAKRIAG